MNSNLKLYSHAGTLLCNKKQTQSGWFSFKLSLHEHDLIIFFSSSADQTLQLDDLFLRLAGCFTVLYNTLC